MRCLREGCEEEARSDSNYCAAHRPRLRSAKKAAKKAKKAKENLPNAMGEHLSPGHLRVFSDELVFVQDTGNEEMVFGPNLVLCFCDRLIRQ